MSIRDYIVKNFQSGLITKIEQESLPKGSASDSLNWLSQGDKITLRSGQSLMGSANNGVGRISGLHVSKLGSSEVVIKSYGRKIKVFNETSQEWDESIAEDILPIVANDDDISFGSYYGLAGSFVYGSGTESGIYKIPLANPRYVIDLGSNTFKGLIKVKQNRMFLWRRKDDTGGNDFTGLYGSNIDKDELADFDDVTSENVGTGDASTTTFSGELTMSRTFKTCTFDNATDVITSTAHGYSNGQKIRFRTISGTMPTGIDEMRTYYVVNQTTDTFQVSTTTSGDAVDFTTDGSGTINSFAEVERTCMYISITDGTETFYDKKDGTLLGNKGGTGTINYATGEFSITFNTAPANAQAITSNYYWENSSDGGITDFTYTSPNRAAGEGFVFRQDDGGSNMQNIGSINGDEYCMHTQKTYRLTLTPDDTDASNLIYRNRVGITNWRALEETGDGIYYIDDVDKANPSIRILQLNTTATDVKPRSISDALELSSYRFDRAVIKEYGDYILVACRTQDSTINNRLIVYNKIWKCFDIMDYRCSTLEENYGTLIAGDDGSNNVFKLFDSFSDEEANIPNYWRSNKTNIGVEGSKETNLFYIKGLISPDQQIKIKISLDDGEFIDKITLDGRGEYVSLSNTFVIGSNLIASEEIGGGGNGIEVSPFEYEFRINTDKYEYIRVEFEAIGLGYVSVSEYQFKDNRLKSRSINPRNAHRL